MLDGAMRRLIDPPLDRAGRAVAALGIGADQVTMLGLALGLAAAGLVALGAYGLALVALVVSRLFDGLDGAVARATEKTDFGGYLDIVADFLFYGAFAASFVVRDPAINAIPAALLLTSFYFNGATFLGYAVLAERHGMETRAQGEKSLYFASGLLEGTETIVFFVLLCLFPAGYPVLAIGFAILCFVTGTARLLLARRVFAGPDQA